MVDKNKMSINLKKIIKCLILLGLADLLLMFFLCNVDMTLNVFNYKLTEYNQKNYQGIKNYYYFTNVLTYAVLSYIAYYFYVVCKKREGIRWTLSFLMKRVLFVILMLIQVIYTMVYFKILFNVMTVFFVKFGALYGSGYFLFLSWITLLYILSFFLIFKFYKLIIKGNYKKSFRKKSFIIFVIFYNIFVYFFSHFVSYGCLHSSSHERSHSRFTEFFVPNSDAINLYEKEEEEEDEIFR